MRALSRAGLAVAFALATTPAPAQVEDPASQPLDIAHVGSVVGPPRGPRLTGAALTAEAERVGSLLRCPVCQGLSVTDSPSGMAINMRGQVRELIAAGFDEDQVLSYYEASYGEFVRLEPPLRGVNWLVWLAPLIGLVAGVAIVLVVLRRSHLVASTAGDEAAPEPKPAAVAEAPPGPASTGSVVADAESAVLDPLPEDPELARLVLRVREIAYGWPRGVRPAKG